MIEVDLKILIAQKEKATKERWSYRRISEETGIPKNSLSQLGRNKVKRLDLDTLNALCNFFQVGPEKILLWTPDGTGPDEVSAPADAT